MDAIGSNDATYFLFAILNVADASRLNVVGYQEQITFKEIFQNFNKSFEQDDYNLRITDGKETMVRAL